MEISYTIASQTSCDDVRWHDLNDFNKYNKKLFSTIEDKLEMLSFLIKYENTSFGHREVSLLTGCPFGRFYSSAKHESINTNISDKYLATLQTILNYKIKKNYIA